MIIIKKKVENKAAIIDAKYSEIGSMTIAWLAVSSGEYFQRVKKNVEILNANLLDYKPLLLHPWCYRPLGSLI